MKTASRRGASLPPVLLSPWEGRENAHRDCGGSRLTATPHICRANRCSAAPARHVFLRIGDVSQGILSESKWRVEVGSAAARFGPFRRLSHLQFAPSDALCSMGTSTFPVALPRPKVLGCPAPVPFLSRATNAIGKPNVRTQQQFSRGEVPRFPSVGCPQWHLRGEDRPAMPPFSTYKSVNLFYFH